MDLNQCLAAIERAAAQLIAADAELAVWARQYAQMHAHRLACDLQMTLARARDSAEVLEFGSSPPILTLALAEQGLVVHGLDISPARFSFPTDVTVDIRQIDFEREVVPLADDSIDVVLMNEVFEHLRIDLIFTLREAARVLRPGGVFLLSTPNHRSMRGLWKLIWKQEGCHMAGEVYDEYERLERLGHMGHVREYTSCEVTRFLARCGLAARETIYRYPERLPRGAARIVGIAERVICGVLPAWRPHFTIVCEKTAGGESAAAGSSDQWRGRPT